MAIAIDLLSRSEEKNGDKGFVDYSSLDIRHLGSIYEGLLEYELILAETDMVATGKKKKIWQTYEDYKKDKTKPKKFTQFDVYDRVKQDGLYLATIRGERKKTGSYYTEQYIVDYIIDNSIRHIIDERWNQSIKENKSIADNILTIKILDPAMGSGHFLIGALELLSDSLLEAIQEDINRGLIEDEEIFNTVWAKRKIVSHCLYGVDINELAVELTKLTLWIWTLSEDQPLNFLDHRLKQGNSLIWTRLGDVYIHPRSKITKDQKKLFPPASFLNVLVSEIKKIDEIEDDSLENIKNKEILFLKLKETKAYRRFKVLCDLRASIFFGDNVGVKKYNSLVSNAYTISDTKWNERLEDEFLINSEKIADKEHFFHWKLEFPEVFFEGGKSKQNAGFDVVLGNPPYIDSEEMTKSQLEVRKYCKGRFPTASGNWDASVVFIEIAINLTKNRGYTSQIVPNKLLAIPYAKEIRKKILENNILAIRDYSSVNVFPDADVYPIVYVLRRTKKPLKTFLTLIEVMGEKLDKASKEKIIYLIRSQKIKKRTLDKITELGLTLSPLFTENLPIVEKVVDNESFKDYFNISDAANTAEAYKIKPLIIDNDFKKLGDDEFKFINTGTIDKYSNKWSITPAQYIKGQYRSPIIKKDALNTISANRVEQSNSKKVILKGMGLDLTGTIDIEGNILAGKSTVILIPKSDKFFEGILEYSLGLINSRLMSFIYVSNFKDISLSGGYMVIGPPQIESLPFKKPEDTELDKIVSQVNQILECTKIINVEAIKFLKWIKREWKCDIDKLKQKTYLYEFWNYDFEKILDVAKNNKSSIQQNPSDIDFQELFEETWNNSTKNILKNLTEIKELSSNIDDLIFHVYGLEKKEIKRISNIKFLGSASYSKEPSKD